MGGTKLKPAPVMNLYNRRRMRKGTIGCFILDKNIQLNLAGSVHTETKKEEIYLDMEFELGNEKDNIEEKLRELNLRLQRLKESSESYSSVAHSILQQSLLTVTLPCVLYAFTFFAFSNTPF